jgi:hypothetical protein
MSAKEASSIRILSHEEAECRARAYQVFADGMGWPVLCLARPSQAALDFESGEEARVISRV